MIRIEAKHALECLQRIAFASEIYEDLSERNQSREVIDVAANEGDDARQRAARAPGAAIRTDELHYRRNMSARRLATGQSHTCALLVNEFLYHEKPGEAPLHALVKEINGKTAVLQTLKVDTVIHTLSFSDDGTFLQTDQGTLHARLLSNSTAASWPSRPQSISIEWPWVSQRGKKMLWLPLEYQPDCVTVHGDIVALGCKSGRVSFIEFASSESLEDPSSYESLSENSCGLEDITADSYNTDHESVFANSDDFEMDLFDPGPTKLASDLPHDDALVNPQEWNDRLFQMERSIIESSTFSKSQIASRMSLGKLFKPSSEMRSNR